MSFVKKQLVIAEQQWVFKTIQSKDENSLSGLRIASSLTLRKEAIEATNKEFVKQAQILAEDVELMKLYEGHIANGNVTTKRFNDTLGKASEAARSQAKALQDGTMSSEVYEKQQKAMITATNGVGTSSKVAALGVKALNVAMNVGLMLAFSAAISIVTKAIQRNEDLRKSAQEAAQAFSDTSSSIDGYKKKIEGLKTALDSGNLSQEEAYNKRAELISIQNEIVDKYGDEAKSIDLVNGSLSSQLDLLLKITSAKANKELTQNSKANKDATKKMENLERYEISTYISSDMEGADALKNLAKEFEASGITIKEDGSGIFSISLEANAKDAEKVLSEFNDKVQKLDFNKSIQSNLDESLTKSLSKNEKLLDDYQEIYDTANMQRVIADNNNIGYDEQYLLATKALQNYNEAVKQGDKDKIASSLDVLKAVKQQSLDLAKNDVGITDFFSNLFSEVDSQLATHDFELKISTNKDGVSDLINQICSKFDDLALIDMIDTKGLQTGEDSFNLLIDKAVEFGYIADNSSKEVKKLIDLLVELGLVQSQNADKPILSFDLLEISDDLSGFNVEIAKVYSQMDILDKAADEVAGTGKVTSETFKSLSDNNLLQYLRFTADGVTVLTDELIASETAVREKAKADLEAALFTDLLHLATTGLSDAELEAKERAENAGTAVENMGTKFANSVDGVLSSAIAVSAFNEANGGTSFNFDGQEEQFNKLLGNYSSAIDAINNMTGVTNSSTNAFNRQASAASDAADAINKQLKSEGDAAIRVIDKKIKSIQDAQKASEKAIDSEIKDTTEEKEAFTEAIDEKIEQTQKEKDSFKETVDANIEAIRKEREEYQKAIDAELEALNERKEALEESIKKGEDAASVVVDLIQEQMDAIDKQKDEVNKFYDEQLEALEKVNKELQDQIALEDALEARDKAKSQKLLVYRKGKGFVAAENEGAVKDAQDNYDQILADQALQAEKDRLEEERNSKLEALDAEKKLLEEYQKLWSDSTSKYEEEMMRKHALEILGQGYEQAILEQRTDILDQFTQFHYDQTVELEENVLSQIDTLTKQKEEELEIFDERLESLEEYRDQELKIYDERLEALNLYKENELKIFEDHIKSLQEQKEREAENYAERIEDLNGYKEQIQDQLSMIGQTWEEHEKDMEAVEKWEAALYDNMAGAIEDYADRVEDAMRRANDAKESGGAPDYDGGKSNNSSGHSDDYYDKKNNVDNVDKGRLNKLATGGVVTEAGWFITDEDGKDEVKVRPKAGKATLLDKGDMVFPHGAFPTDPVSLMMSFAREHPMIPERIQEATDNMGKVINNTTVNRQEAVNLHFHGDMSFPNITDPNDSKRLVRALLDMGRESYQLPE